VRMGSVNVSQNSQRIAVVMRFVGLMAVAIKVK